MPGRESRMKKDAMKKLFKPLNKEMIPLESISDKVGPRHQTRLKETF